MLIFLSSIFSFSTTDIKKNENFQLNIKENKLKASKFWDLTGSSIFIDDNDPSKNWSYTASHYDWCSGSGNWTDPYIIENVTIDGQGSGNCIEIRNSDAYFIIQNCSLYNSGSYSDNAGIKLYYVDNGKIINNNCSDNSYYGIYLGGSSNNTLSGNTANNNLWGIYLDHSDNNTLSGNTGNNNAYGISLIYSDNNTLSGNTANNNSHGIYLYSSRNNTLSGNTADNNYYGIRIENSNNNTISENNASNNDNAGIYLCYSNNHNLSGNLMNFCGISLKGSLVEMASHSIDNTNLVYNKPVYYYVNETGLGSSNFTGAGQIILINCNNSIISGFNLSNGTTGIHLYYSNNNTLSGNTASNNIYFGIHLSDSYNNMLSGNTANNNMYGMLLSSSDKNMLSGNRAYSNNLGGIALGSSNNNTLWGNTVNTNDDYGIYLGGSSNNTISGNTANNNHYGIYLDNSDNNTFSGNNASNNNNSGIFLDRSNSNNTFSGNNANNNYYGILLSSSDTNRFSGNTIRDNNYYGIYIYGGTESTYNLFINNSFLNNIVNAYDDGIDNYWNNSVIGNYWGDYNGEDSNDDGIGDTPYSISGSVNSQDNYPIWWDSIVISINNPNPNEFFGTTAPSFTISIDKGLAHTTWYTIDNGLTNITFTGSTGTVDQTEWNKISSDFVTLTFYANDTLGVISSSQVVICKDVVNPIIIINSPKPNDLIGVITPSFNVEVTDANLDTMWYTIDGGITNTTFTENGTINQELWDALSNGTATITFYANDSAGNEASNSVIVRVDNIIPSIIIHSPIENQLFGTNVPSPMFNISVDDIFHDKKWYTLNQDSTKYFFTSPWDYINQTAWFGLPDGSVKMRFYANNSAGNIGFSEVTIRKDINAPIITINNPQNNVVIGATAPNFNITIDESNLDKVWYSLNGGTNITFTGLTGTINQTLWDALPDGNVVIKFYANDTLGRIGFQEVTVVKEITQPSPPGISGYNLLFLLGIISVMVAIIVKKRINHLN